MPEPKVVWGADESALFQSHTVLRFWFADFQALLVDAAIKEALHEGRGLGAVDLDTQAVVRAQHASGQVEPGFGDSAVAVFGRNAGYLQLTVSTQYLAQSGGGW